VFFILGSLAACAALVVIYVALYRPLLAHIDTQTTDCRCGRRGRAWLWRVALPRWPRDSVRRAGACSSTFRTRRWPRFRTSRRSLRSCVKRSTSGAACSASGAAPALAALAMARHARACPMWFSGVAPTGLPIAMAMKALGLVVQVAEGRSVVVGDRVPRIYSPKAAGGRL
jgi:hypothetical protein